MLLGFLNINKPKGMTSHDVISRLRRVSKIRQIGHTGTLDPLAQGVLPVAVGKATRLIEFLLENKAYIATLEFGKISDTYDIEGNVEGYSDVRVAEEEIVCALEKFVGEIEQIPPAYSAVHYNGKRLYELAREGKIPEDIPKRTVFISKLNLLDFNPDTNVARIEIECSKGTYVRSIVNDLGQILGCGAVMTDLVRTKSGLFDIGSSVPLDMFVDISDVEKYLINPIEVLSYSCYTLTEFEYQKIKHGQSIETDSFEDNEFVILEYDGDLSAIAQKDNNKLVMKKVFI